VATIRYVNNERAECGLCANRCKGAYYVPNCFKPECSLPDYVACDECGQREYVIPKYGFCIIKKVSRKKDAPICDEYQRCANDQRTR
jgi:hypothetical protein